MINTIQISICCKADVIEDFEENPNDHHDPFPIYRCMKCKLSCDVEDVCEECRGDGEVTTMEAVYNDDPSILAPIGSAPCPGCRGVDDADFSGSDNEDR